MRCPHGRSTASLERSDRTAHGYRRFRCRECRRGFNERTGSVPNRLGQGVQGYVRTSAQKHARARRSRHRLKLSLKPVLRNHVIAKLRKGCSPH